MLQLPESHLMLVDEFNHCLRIQEAALRGWWGYQYLSILICTFQYSDFLPKSKSKSRVRALPHVLIIFVPCDLKCLRSTLALQ